MNLDEKIFGLGSWTRRRFVQMSAASAMSAGLGNLAHAEAGGSASMIDVPFEKRNPRIAIIGTGGRGTNLLENLLAADAQVVSSVRRRQSRRRSTRSSLVVASGQKNPELYTDGPHAFEAMLSRQDADLVVVATPWNWHAEMAVSAMRHGKDVAVEVPAVTTIEDCWQIVKTSEETRKHCMMLENCCYGYNETLILRMVHAGKFGDLLYGEEPIFTIYARSSSQTPARVCGDGQSTPSATGTSIRLTVWGRWRIIWESSAAIDSAISSR